MIGIGFIFAIGPALAMIGLAALGYWAFTRWQPGRTTPGPSPH